MELSHILVLMTLPMLERFCAVVLLTHAAFPQPVVYVFRILLHLGCHLVAFRF